MSPRLRHLIPPAILIAAAAVACGRESASSPRYSDESVAAASVQSKDMMATPPMPESRMAVAADASVGSAGRAAPGPGGVTMPATAAAEQGAPSATSMIIRTGSASVEVDSLEVAIAAVQRIATSLGGWVGNTSVSTGANEMRSATIELKIPAARYDEALAGLKPLGKVESVASNAEDVGEEFVDLSARVANARRLEDRLITLLATRAGKLEDVLNVERELARVREEIERYDGRLRYLRSRVATSTLTVTVHEPAPLVSERPGDNIIGEAFRDAWRNFVFFVAAGIASLGTIIPILVLAGLGWMGWRRFRGRRGTGGVTGADGTA